MKNFTETNFWIENKINAIQSKDQYYKGFPNEMEFLKLSEEIAIGSNGFLFKIIPKNKATGIIYEAKDNQFLCDHKNLLNIVISDNLLNLIFDDGMELHEFKIPSEGPGSVYMAKFDKVKYYRRYVNNETIDRFEAIP